MRTPLKHPPGTPLNELSGVVMGVVMGMFAFHHKTSKTSFQVKVAVAMVLVLPIRSHIDYRACVMSLVTIVALITPRKDLKKLMYEK